MAELPNHREVFLSHRWANKDFVRKLAADIETQTHKGRQLLTWVDDAEIKAGQSIVAMLSEGIEKSHFVALVMTPEYFTSESGWTDAEWHAAIFDDPDNRRGKLLPLLVADCPRIPMLLRHLKMIDFRGNRYEAGFKELLSVLRDEPLPRPVPFRGQLVESNGRISRETLLAERAIPDADPDVSSERLYSNLLPVELPKFLYVATVGEEVRRANGKGELAMPTKKAAVEIVRKALQDVGQNPFTPAFRFRGEELFTFHDLDDPEGPLAVLINEATVRTEPTAKFLENEDDRRIAISLLNMALSRHLQGRGLVLDDNRQGRVFFPPTPDNLQPRTVRWRPTRNRAATRTVAKPYMKNDELVGWIHPAAYMQIVYLSARCFVKITPTRVFTTDGIHTKTGPDVGRIVIRWLGQERNIHVLYNVRFWTMILRRRPGPTISIWVGDQTLEVEPTPAFIDQAYGIGSDRMNLMDRLGEEAELIAHEEDAAQIEVTTSDDEDDIGVIDVSGDEALDTEEDNDSTT